MFKQFFLMKINMNRREETCFKSVFVVLLLNQFVSATNSLSFEKKPTNHSCYTCVEPLVGYTDFPNSCRSFNKSSLLAHSYMKQCTSENGETEFECRKFVVSYRSVDTFLVRDCAPKGKCSWKDKTQSMINRPVSDCVYTDDDDQRLECIYCCDTPLCNRISSNFHFSIDSTKIFFFLYFLRSQI